MDASCRRSFRWSPLFILGLLAFLSASSNAAMNLGQVEVLGGYKRRAEKGDVLAQFQLGNLYYTGKDMAKDWEQAVSWHRKAAEQGHAKAQYYMGVYYMTGEGVAKDEVQAVFWFRKAAEQGDSEAQADLGFCYASGSGVAKDEVEALKWTRKAAEQGNPAAQYNLGRKYFDGEGGGVKKDEVLALSLFRKAADQGYASSQVMLGYCYVTGRAVTKDFVEAYAYWSLAGVSVEGARMNLVGLEKKMTAEQVDAGKKRAKELLKEIEAKIADKKAGK